MWFHIIQVPLIGLIALTVYLLTEGLEGRAVMVSRWAMAVFAVFFSAYDAAASIAKRGPRPGRRACFGSAPRNDLCAASVRRFAHAWWPKATLLAARRLHREGFGRQAGASALGRACLAENGGKGASRG
jgi:hypothetical protein